MTIFSYGKWNSCRGLACLAALAMVFTLSCASKPVKDYRLVAQGSLSASRVVIVNGVKVAAVYLDEKHLAETLREKGYERLSNTLQELPLDYFLLTITNGASLPVDFNPREANLMDGGWNNLSPVDFSDLYMLLPPGSGRKTVLQDLQKLTLNRVVRIKPGKTLEGMFLFQRPESMGKNVILALDGFYLDGKPLTVVLTFNAISREGE
ncbi:MAG: hypothetical protein GXP52_00430 [Deltaproteobacteria bacterium]|nr:hypothetical protein [Deltaproteobacteria bacterium]